MNKLLTFSVGALVSLAFAGLLGAAEPAAVFNGKDLTGWKAIGGPIESWGVEGDVLYTTGKGGGWLSLDRELADFELELEFKVGDNGNSGVFIRAPHEGSPWIDGMEIQLLDDYGDQYKTLQPYQYTGSVYGVVPSTPRVTKKAGEWQSIKIRAQGSKITVTVNGKDVVKADLKEHQSAAKEHPGINRPQGFIGLQNHGTRVEFRKIRLAELK